ncbi:MAG: twitching motility protein, partial [Frankiales bacterium]|nr:twitching motility protein [Frankiales bacterium]
MPAWRAGAFARPREGTHVDEQTPTPAGLDGYYEAPQGAPSPLDPTWVAAPAMQHASPMQLSTESTVSFAPVAPAAPQAVPAVAHPAAEAPTPVPVSLAPVAPAVAAEPMPPAATLAAPPQQVPLQATALQQQQPEPVVAVRVGGASTTEDSNFLADLLIHVLDTGCSDLHMTVGAHPTVRLNGHLTPMEDYPVLTPQVIQKTLYAIL